MQVSLRVLGEVKVNDNVDSLDVDTSGEEICLKKQFVFNLQWLFKIKRGGKGSHRNLKLTSADQVSTETISEIVKHAVSIFLKGRRRQQLINSTNKPIQLQHFVACLLTCIILAWM